MSAVEISAIKTVSAVEISVINIASAIEISGMGVVHAVEMVGIGVDSIDTKVGDLPKDIGGDLGYSLQDIHQVLSEISINAVG